MISQIETGKSRPSVSTLYAITSALEMSIEDVFSKGERAEPADPAAAALPASGVALAEPAGPAGTTPPDGAVGAAIGAAIPGAVGALLARPADPGAPRLGPLVHPDERQVLRLDSGVTWERLGELRDRSVDFLLITYAPGATSSSRSELMRHSGAEYGYLLRGELVLTLGFEEVRLCPGDAISFDSTTPHGYRNDGTEPAVGVWFVLEDH
jgi:quercetin dioxygenase-like cupin family protein